MLKTILFPQRKTTAGMTSASRVLRAQLVALCFVVSSVDASAFSEYTAQLPAAPSGCQTCHAGNVNEQRNAFGLDVETTLRSDGNVSWAALFNVDSDGDGRTNGAELGDPCGLWSSGETLRGYDITDPADAEQTNISATDGCGEFEPPPNYECPAIADSEDGGVVDTVITRPYECEGLINDTRQQQSLFGGCTGGGGGCGGQGQQNQQNGLYTFLFPITGLGLLRLRTRRAKKKRE